MFYVELSLKHAEHLNANGSQSVKEQKRSFFIYYYLSVGSQETRRQ